jgi:dCTP deaminase
MLLSDRDIRRALDASDLLIEPLDRRQIQPSSVDVRLGSSFRRYLKSDATVIDSEAPQAQVTETFEVAAGDSLLLQPHELLLGCTMERVRLPKGIAGILEGKSSLGRLGIFMHTNAGLIDPGFEGTITLNLLNVAALPIKIRPGMRIGQLCFFQLSSDAQRPYGSVGLNSHYQNQLGPTPSWGAEGTHTS